MDTNDQNIDTYDQAIDTYDQDTNPYDQTIDTAEYRYHGKGKKSLKKKKKKEKPYKGLRIAAIILSIILFFEATYCFLVFTNIPTIKYWREQYIATALSTMSHHWLAEWFLPEYMIEDIKNKKEQAQQMQHDEISQRPDSADSSDPNSNTPPMNAGLSTAPIVTVPGDTPEQAAFYHLFWELNRSTFEAYIEEHPEVLSNGWENIYINEAGLNDKGTSIYTSMGEQVLAIDAKNKILLVRVQGTGYLGILAIGKDPSQIRCEASAGIGKYGQAIGTICKNSGGIVGITGSGFMDPDGNGNGGLVAGRTICEGKGYGQASPAFLSKRIELSTDNRFYISNSSTPIPDDVTDSVEFEPALVVDGKLTVDGYNSYNGINPRAAIGQSAYGEILMLVIEGRQIGRSIGTDVETCAKLLMRHNAYTAMNLDGGTSAVMWYDGEYVTKCSNASIQCRSLPNAWVYGNNN